MAGKLKVYISSTFLDMQEAREKIIDRIHKGMSPYFELTEIMEKMSGDPTNRTNVDICLAEVRKADLYILITGKRYGSYPHTYTSKDGKLVDNTEKKSYTELEYEAACETLNDKFYGIYKLELTDEYFIDEAVINYTDLNEENRQQGYNRFQQKLDETVSTIKISRGELLNKTINNKLTEFYLLYNTKEELDITYFEKASIDRKPQFEQVKDIEIGPGAFTFLIDAENEDDGCSEFGNRLKELRTRRQPDKIGIEIINSSVIASGVNSNNTEKQLQKLLIECSASIFEEYQASLTFERLAKQLDAMNKNAFVFFYVNDAVDSRLPFSFPQLIAEFVKRIDSLLKEKDFPYNFFFLLYFFSEQAKNPGADCAGYFKELQHHYVGRLPNVNLDDITEWTEQIKQNRSMDEDTDSLVKLIFTDTSIFPVKYKKCITIIDKRTKKQP
jgi:Domain of unknown function (DUF4062)